MITKYLMWCVGRNTGREKVDSELCSWCGDLRTTVSKRQVVRRGPFLGYRRKWLMGGKKVVGRKHYYSVCALSELQVYDTGKGKPGNSGRPGT